MTGPDLAPSLDIATAKQLVSDILDRIPTAPVAPPAPIPVTPVATSVAHLTHPASVDTSGTIEQIEAVQVASYNANPARAEAFLTAYRMWGAALPNYGDPSVTAAALRGLLNDAMEPGGTSINWWDGREMTTCMSGHGDPAMACQCQFVRHQLGTDDLPSEVQRIAAFYNTAAANAPDGVTGVAWHLRPNPTPEDGRGPEIIVP